MPVCQGCGGSFDDQFKFCPYCGRAKPEPLTINVNVTSNDIWEICEVKFVRILSKNLPFRTESVFEAEAIGPQGRYVAARSEKMDYNAWGANNDYVYRETDGGREKDTSAYAYSETDQVLFLKKKTQPKLDALIQKLVSEGWQPTDGGKEWYSVKFRRLVKGPKG